MFSKKKIIGVGLISLAISVASVGYMQTRSTISVSASDFEPGYIIDDAIFYNGADLSTSQIQDFLEDRMPDCDTWGEEMYNSSMTRAEYAATRGEFPPFECLRDYSNTYDARPADSLCDAIPAGTKSAARVIHEVSEACDVSAKALLVMIEKESGLLTDEWPWVSQYRTIMGYGCPDTGPGYTANCNANYYGYYNQMYNAGRQLQNYAQNPQNYRYSVGETIDIQYHPNPSCGDDPVYLQNAATAALYNYTPYQPNQASLDAFPGTGNSCSSYGNRNFWFMFNNWFGPSQFAQYVDIGSALGGRDFQKINLAGAGTDLLELSDETGSTPEVIVHDGVEYVFTYNYDNNSLDVAYNDGDWNYETLDGSGGIADGAVSRNVGSHPTATVWNNKIYVAYYDWTNQDVRITRQLSGGGWKSYVLDGSKNTSSGQIKAAVGYRASISTYSEDNSLHVVYFNDTNNDIRHSYIRPGDSSWTRETLDGSDFAISGKKRNVGVYSSITEHNDKLYVAYNQPSMTDLRIAEFDGSSWDFDLLDGRDGSISDSPRKVGKHVSAVSADGDLYVFYYHDSSYDDLRYAKLDGNTWTFKVLDGRSSSESGLETRAGIHTVASVNEDGDILVAYVSYDNLRAAVYDGSTWRFRTLDGSSGSLSGFATSKDIKTPTADFTGDEVTIFYQFDGRLLSIEEF